MAQGVAPVTAHPARYSEALLPIFANLLQMTVGVGARVLDPFAGTGRIHELYPTYETTGVEIEPEWAHMHPRTLVGNALALDFANGTFDAIVTSPTYGNRMADHHDAKDTSKRITYRHRLGRALHPDNSGQLQWGPRYQNFHALAWGEAVRVLRPGGVFILNISDHIRGGSVVPVSEWHRSYLQSEHGLMLGVDIEVETPRMKFGANGALRTDSENVFLFVKPKTQPDPTEGNHP